MNAPSPHEPIPAPCHVCDLLQHDLTALLVTSRAIARSLQALRPECGFAPEIVRRVDELIAISRQGEARLRAPLSQAGIVLQAGVEAGAGGLVSSFFVRLPVGAGHDELASEIVVSLRLLAQHMELKSRLAGELAFLVGQKALRQGLLAWARDWCACGQNLRAVTDRPAAEPEQTHDDAIAAPFAWRPRFG